MDSPFEGTSQGYYAGASDVLNPFTSNIFESSSLDDPDLQSLHCILEEACPDLHNCLYNESCNAALYDSSVAWAPGAAAQSECKLQPSMYNGSVSVSCTYNPPPSGQVVHLQYLQPALFLPAGDKVADVLSNIGACNQAHDNFPFSFSPVEARSKLTSSMNHESFPWKWGLPRLDVPTSPIAYGNSGAASPAYNMHSSTFSGAAAKSDSVAIEISSVSAPVAPATSSSWTCAPSE